MATSIDLGPALTQIGIGALIAVPAYATAWKLWGAREKALAENTRLRDDQIARERELAERTVPALVEAAKMLAQAPDRFDRALDRVRNRDR